MALVIKLGNSYSKVEGMTSAQHKELSKILSYQIGDGYNSPIYVRSLLSKRGEFPTGLLSRVTSYLKNYKLVEELFSHRFSDTEFEFNKTKIFYVEQKEAISVCIRKGRGLIRMPTGTGKSMTIAGLIHALQVRTLIVVPNLGLKTQLQSTIDELLDYPDRRLVCVENIDSSALNNLTDFDCLIIDEAHHSAASTYRQLNRKVWKNIHYRFCFTATPFRSGPEEQILMESITGGTIYTLPYMIAVSKKYIVPVEAYYLDLPKTIPDGYTWNQIYKELVVDNAVRNDALISIIKSLNDAGKSCLTLIKEVKHGEYLSKKSGSPLANGENKEADQLIEDFSNKKSISLIATTGICGEGRDTKACEYVIIGGLGKSKNAFMQQIGRAVRTYEGKQSAKIILIRDPSHKWTLAHFNAQKKILKEEYGVIPTKLVVDLGSSV